MLQQLSDQTIKQFAGATIYKRGHEYYTSQAVSALQYDAGTDSLTASVAGQQDDYDVSASMGAGGLSAKCDCPYEGYPCKHIVAALLTFIHGKEQYVQQDTARQKTASSLTKKVNALSKDELVEIVLSAAKKYPEMKRDLMVRLEGEKKVTFDAIKSQIARAFPSIQSRHYSTRDIARQLKPILKSVENANPELQSKVYWAIADRTLKELNDYGMNDESLENIAIDAMENLVKAFTANDALRPFKADVIDQLMGHYNRGNCGLVDFIYETVTDLCANAADYQVVINALERRLKHEKTFPSYYQGLLSELYARIGNTDAQRKTLEANLRYGTDYWRLAEYWFQQGDSAKGWEIVQTGLDKGEGNKQDLYTALHKHYAKHGQYDQIVALLHRKVERNELDYRGSFPHDSTYQYLWEYYRKHDDYAGLNMLLEMRLEHRNLDIEFYHLAEDTLTSEDWETFEPRIIAVLQEKVTAQQQQRTRYGFPLPSFQQPAEVDILAEIYRYKQEIEALFELVKQHHSLLKKYADLLLPRYPREYLDAYRQQAARLIAARDRKNYKAAAAYANIIKQIYIEHLNDPDEWQQYITNLRRQNKTLRALQEELAGL